MRTLILSLCGGLLFFLGGPAKADEPKEGKPSTPFRGSLEGWKGRGGKTGKWKVGIAGLEDKNPAKITFTEGDPAKKQALELVNDNGGGGVDFWTEQKWGDATILVEVMVPKGSNSGIYVMGEYEVQILDSYGREKVGPGDMGGLYGASAPKVNASKKPGEWQDFIIEYQAPRFEGGKKVSNMKFLKITLNGKVIHENVEMKGPTPTGVSGKEAATGPLMFQGDHGPVAFRNIRIIPGEGKGK